MALCWASLQLSWRYTSSQIGEQAFHSHQRPSGFPGNGAGYYSPPGAYQGLPWSHLLSCLKALACSLCTSLGWDGGSFRLGLREGLFSAVSTVTGSQASVALCRHWAQPLGSPSWQHTEPDRSSAGMKGLSRHVNNRKLQQQAPEEHASRLIAPGWCAYDDWASAMSVQIGGIQSSTCGSGAR